MKNTVAILAATLLLVAMPIHAQTTISKTKCGYFMPFNWHTAMPGIFDLTINPETQEMTIIPLSPNFQGIQSIAIHSEFHCNAVADCGPYEFIVPWHPDSLHTVPLPAEFFECGVGVEPYVWRICWMEEITEILNSNSFKN